MLILKFSGSAWLLSSLGWFLADFSISHSKVISAPLKNANSYSDRKLHEKSR